jgi:hypothetical protein
MTKMTVPTQNPRPSRREVFENKQAEHARRFALREKVAAIIKREIAPLAIDDRPFIFRSSERTGFPTSA